MATGKYISYLRVSTEKQGRSGLGLEAQRRAVEDFLNGGRWKLVEEYVEVETGKKADRPQLQAALNHAKLTGATLVVAKLDRLSRNAHFLTGLQEGGVPFVCADMPEANEMVIGIMVQIAQWEGKMISERTKAALASVKEHIKKDKKYKARSGKDIKRLGNPNGAQCLRGIGNDAAVEVIKAKAANRAEGLRPTIEALQSDGVTSTRGIANALNEKGILSGRGGQWHASTVSALLKRLREAA